MEQETNREPQRERKRMFVGILSPRSPKGVAIYFVHTLNALNNVASGISDVQAYEDVHEIEAGWTLHRDDLKRGSID